MEKIFTSAIEIRISLGVKVILGTGVGKKIVDCAQQDTEAYELFRVEYSRIL